MDLGESFEQVKLNLYVDGLSPKISGMRFLLRSFFREINSRLFVTGF
jgi:hypothetical protein